MSNQPPNDPPPLPRGNGKGSAPAGGAGANWRVIILMAVALGILFMAWKSNSFGKPERLSYTKFRDYVDSGKIITSQDLPKKGEGKFPDNRFELKKSGESAAVQKITGFFYKTDPWVVDKKNAPREVFRIPINTELNDDQLKTILARHPIPLRTVANLPVQATDGMLLTLGDLRRMLARGEVIKNDPANPFEIVSLKGSDDKYIIGERYVFGAADPATKEDDLAPFELDVNYMELTDAERQFINDLVPFEPDSGMMRVFLLNILPIFLVILIIFFLFRHQMKSAGRGVQGRRRYRGGEGRACRSRGIPARPEKIPETRRQPAQGLAHGWPSRHWKNPARPRHRGGSRCAILLDLRLRLRGNVCRCRCQPRPRHVRAGAEKLPVPHLHR